MNFSPEVWNVIIAAVSSALTLLASRLASKPPVVPPPIVPGPVVPPTPADPQRPLLSLILLLLQGLIKR